MDLSNILGNEIILLFIIISFGKIIERFKIGKFSLGPASVFIIAAIFGYYGYSISDTFKTFGLAIFVYCVGIETGPLFFTSIKNKNYKFSFITIIQIFLTLTITFIFYFIFQDMFSKDLFLGIFSGSIASTPALATILDRIPSSDIGAGFAIIYPFSLIGNIYLITYLPKLFKSNIEMSKKEHHETIKKFNPQRMKRIFKITNKNIIGKNFNEVEKLTPEEVVFSRYINTNKENILINDDILLEEDAFLVAIGTKNDLENLDYIIGESQSTDYTEKNKYITKKLLISKQEIAGRTIKELQLEDKYHIKITRIIRTGLELAPKPSRQIILGDRIVIFGSEKDISKVTKILGNEVEEMFKTQFAPISIGIILGILIGIIPIPYLNVPLGITGGILLVSMILGYKVKAFGTLWQIPNQTTNFLKQLSLSIFFAAIGSNTDFSIIFSNANQLYLILIVIVVSYLPVIITYIITIKFLKYDCLNMLGIISGNVENTSVLLSINETYQTDIPNSKFAFSYPLSIIISIIIAQILSFIFQLI